MKKIKLSNKELEVMFVLWRTPNALTATDFPHINPALNINTVQVALKNLLKKSYIKISEIVYHGKVLTRSYAPVLTQEDYLLEQFRESQFSTSNFMAALVKTEENLDDLLELERIINLQKTKLIKGDD